ncbi:MAG: 16S rRNA (guanine(527)-N(7))-methyltransferase RsmG [Thermodesulfovibrionales bacterium]|nr:16S rRNA (guanine(527)-N(7))-methyltransferase RsmG [Thermodesulfovibrionales bacterium]
MELIDKQELIIKGLDFLGIRPETFLLESFLLYLEELQRWNKAYNLTSIKGDKDIIIKHFLDSLLYLKFIPEVSCYVCDVGSGAGFPGLPIAIVRQDLNLTLIEPSWKKCAFLKYMINKLRLLNVTVVEARVENYRDSRFDVLATRALFNIGDFIKAAAHLLSEKGFFIMSKGPSIKKDIQEVSSNYTIEVLQINLPLTSILRNIVKISPVKNLSLRS